MVSLGLHTNNLKNLLSKLELFIKQQNCHYASLSIFNETLIKVFSNFVSHKIVTLLG